MKIILNQNIIDFLTEKRIYLQFRGENNTLRPGMDFHFPDGLELEPYCGFYGGNNTLCNMGSFSYSSSGVHAGASIGRYCSIAWAVFYQSENHPYNYVSTSPFSYQHHDFIRFFASDTSHDLSAQTKLSGATEKPLPVIENDVWIGSDVFLNRGITIGTGAIVASKSVVTKNVNPYEIVGGNPARLIRMRFDPDIVSMLLLSQWWRYRFSDFANLPIDSPGEFVREFLSLKSSIDPFLPNKITAQDIINLL